MYYVTNYDNYPYFYNHQNTTINPTSEHKNK